MQIGNALINDETDTQGMLDYLETHAIISDRNVYQLQKYCNFSSNASTPSHECIAASEAASKDISYINISPRFMLPSAPQPKKTSVSDKFF